MTDLAIRAENLGKRYRIGGRKKGYRTLQETILNMASAPGRLLRRRIPDEEIFWALREVSFEMRQGDVLGVIGRNGAGKSTLLKVLSRITEPTEGFAEVRGRIASLLEVGTGFHPELTGRENIFLNGAILGMKRTEISRKFDEIVDFAGSDAFIDTPVKHYSSGMYLRLAFAVAAHLEPEILVVDEVLAVGDAEFQKKCLGKLTDVSREGRTVLFVSHNMSAIRSLCKQGIVMDHGHIAFEGTAQEAVSFYLEGNTRVQTAADLSGVRHKGTGKARLQNITLLSEHPDGSFPKMGDDIAFTVQVRALAEIRNATLCLFIYDHLGARIIDATTAMLRQTISLQAGEESTWRFDLYDVLLRPARYQIELSLVTEGIEVYDWVQEALAFDVLLDSQNTYGVWDYPGSYRCRFNISRVEVNEMNGASGTSANQG